MIKYYNKISGGKLKECPKSEEWHWINISPPFNQEELELVSKEYNIEFDFLTDSLDIDERSRYEIEDDSKLIVINTPIINELDSLNEAIYITVPIGIVMFSDKLLTISSFENPIIHMFLENRVRNFTPSDTTHFILQLFEYTVYRYLKCLKKLNMKRNLIEQELADSGRNNELLQLLRVQKSLVYFVNSLSSNELLMMKMKRTDFLGIREEEEKYDFLDDIIIDNSQAHEMSNVYSNILRGTVESYASIISNNLNIVIQRLTIVTIILMVPTLFASFYGMNVPLPFQEEDSALYYIVFISFIVSGFLSWFFYRKKLF